ncbi:MAG: DUF2807 domain-containing protein [Bacteroidetes bacterium]|nr:DUF2807 domain-containing protein [Bacteroidota bacterium]
MKKNLLTLFCLMFVNLTSYGCAIIGSGVLSSETRNLSEFNGIDLRSAANVYVTQGDKQEVRIEADDNIVPHITSEIKNNCLVISNDNDLKAKSPITIYITVKEICSIELSGSGNINGMNTLNCEHMTLRLSGSGDIRVNLDTKSLKATLAGSGNVDLKGRAAETDLRITGSGNVNAKELNSFKSAISITGSGNGSVNVQSELDVNILGSGNLYYVSKPDHIQTKVLGSGKVSEI